MSTVDWGADIERLLAEQLVRRREQEGGFALEPWHDRIREALLDGFEPDVLARLHRSLARTLLELMEEQVEPERLGRHWLGAGEPQRAAEAFVIAANKALDELAFDHAAERFTRAAELLPGGLSAEHRSRQADALYLSGRTGEAAMTRLALLDTLRPDDPERGVTATWLVEAGRATEAQRILDALLKAHGFRVPSSLGALLSYLRRRRRLVSRWRARRPGFGPTTSPEDWARSEVLRTGVQVYAAVNTAVAGHYALLGYEYALTTGSQRVLGEWTAWLGSLLAPGGAARRGQVLAVMAEAERLIGSDSPYLSSLQSAVGAAHMRFGEWPQAAQCFDGLLEQLILDRSDRVLINVLTWNHLRCLFCLGDLPAMTRAAHRYRTFNRQKDRSVFSITAAFLALSALADDDREASLRHLSRFRLDRLRGYNYGNLVLWMAHSRIHLYLQRPTASLRRIAFERDRLLRSMMLFPQENRIWIATLLARLHMTAAHRGEGGSLLFAQALALMLARESCVWGPVLGRAIQAGLAMMRGQRPAAKRELQMAIAGFDRVGMTLFAASARHQLARLEGNDRLASQAANLFSAAGVVAPERWANAWCPGFWDH
ncbi:MAG: hypothetical protein AAFX99_05885 [Myxococcota bacterium]